MDIDNLFYPTYVVIYSILCSYLFSSWAVGILSNKMSRQSVKFVDVPLSKAHNPNLLQGCRATMAAPVKQHISPQLSGLRDNKTYVEQCDEKVYILINRTICSVKCYIRGVPGMYYVGGIL